MHWVLPGGSSGGVAGGFRLQDVGAQVLLGLLDVVVHCATRLLGVSGPDGGREGVARAPGIAGHDDQARGFESRRPRQRLTHDPPHLPDRRDPGGRGPATLVIPTPRSVRPPTDNTAAMITWLSADGAPYTGRGAHAAAARRVDDRADQPRRRHPQRPVVTACFPDVEQARAAARRYRGCVSDVMRGHRPVPRAGGPPSRAGGA
jgi:hypothetical protein